VGGSRATPHPRYFIGTGKADEIAQIVKDKKADVVLFNHRLSPAQERNLERLVECRVIDRTGLILDIFAQRAQTHEGKLQVELAQLNHLSTRLVRGWTHLERQKGGIGMRGPGETQIESDRRVINDKIARLKAKLAKIDKQKSVQRGNRGKMVRVALVGYTNVGKSTTMNLLSKSKVFAENKLFATLDTTVRKVVLQNIPFLLSDTVGFIRKLPHQLVESFKSTLDEVREADLLVHILDISHPAFEDHYNTVNETLQEIDGLNKPTILVFNKVDAYNEKVHFYGDEHDRPPLEELKKTWMAKMHDQCIFISAYKKINIDEFRKVLYDEVRKIHITRFPYNDFLYQEYIPTDEEE